MSKNLLMLIIFALLFFSACQPTQEITPPVTGPTIEPTQEKTDKFIELIKSNLLRELNPNVEQEQIMLLAEDNTSFAIKFYNQIRNEDGNIVFSPLSLSMALSMALAGAETKTEQDMLTALQMRLPENEVHAAFNALMLSIEASQAQGFEESEGNKFQLNIANSIWGQADYNFNQPFLDTLAQYYSAGIFAVDFIQNPEAARLAINDWVSEETEQKIEDLIPEGAIDTLTRLVLANAIYFNGSWFYPFNAEATIQALFYKLDGSEVTVDRMRLYGESLVYGRGENYQAVNLPYLSSDFVMTLLVPDDGTFNEFEAELNQELLSNILTNMIFSRVDLEMPRFDFETNINANEILIALGMGSAFDPGAADFSGITDEDELMISDVLHKATITVDEEGTEAAAATAIIIGVTSAMPEEPISLIVDRPFMFMIRHVPTNTILFMGRVLEP